MLLTLRIIAWRSRRAVAVLALGALALVAAHLAAPPAAPTRAVVVAARDVPAGTTLGDGDLRVVRLPAALVPEEAHADPADVRGRVLATPLPRGMPVASPALTAGRFAVAPPPGSAVVSLEVDPGLLTPGDRVDLLAVGCTDGYGSTVTWGAAPAVDLPGTTGTAGADDGTTGGSAPTAGTLAEAALVVDVGEQTATVAVDPVAGRAVAGAGAGCTVRALLRT